MDYRFPLRTCPRLDGTPLHSEFLIFFIFYLFFALWFALNFHSPDRLAGILPDSGLNSSFHVPVSVCHLILINYCYPHNWFLLFCQPDMSNDTIVFTEKLNLSYIWWCIWFCLFSINYCKAVLRQSVLFKVLYKWRWLGLTMRWSFVLFYLGS